MNNLKFNAILSAAFATVLTVACYPLAAPVVGCIAASLPVNWVAWLDAIGFDMWSVFWLSGAWLGHIPFMFAAFCLLFLVLLGYTVAKDAERNRNVDEGIYGDAHVVRGAAELNRRNDFWAVLGGFTYTYRALMDVVTIADEWPETARSREDLKACLRSVAAARGGE